jgi:hypothetical protein
MSWIDQVMAATAEAETPRSFVKWAALSAISAVVADRVYLDKFYYKLYPNIYVLLIADSGLRKGFAASLAKLLVSKIDNTRVISGRNSIEAIIKDLSTTVTRPKRAPLTKAHGFIVSGELSTTFIDNPFTFTILTDLHDGHYHSEGWKVTLKSTGVEQLKDISVTMLGAVNPPLFKSMITQKDVTGGFVARCIIVEEKRRALKNALTRAPVVSLNIEELLKHLQEISEVTGQFVWEEEARDFFESWYNKYNPEELSDETGTANRIHDQILKVAMLLSLSESKELVLCIHHITDAMELLNHATATASSIGKGQGLTDFGPKIKLVLEELYNSKEHRVTRSLLLRKYWGDFTSHELDVIVDTLEKAGGIRVDKRGPRDFLYVASQRLLEDMEVRQRPLRQV